MKRLLGILFVAALMAGCARYQYAIVEPAHLAWFREDLWLPMTRNPREAAWIVVYAPATRACPLPPDARTCPTSAIVLLSGDHARLAWATIG